MKVSYLGINMGPYGTISIYILCLSSHIFFPPLLREGKLPEVFLKCKKVQCHFYDTADFIIKQKHFLQAKPMVIKFQLTGQEHCQIKLIRSLIINRRRRRRKIVSG